MQLPRLQALAVLKIACAPVSQVGFSLVESLVSLAVLAAILSSAIPGLVGLVQQFRADAAVNSFTSSVILARSEAIARNGRVVVCKSTNGKVCERAGGWEQGWIIFSDTNNNAQVDVDESLVMAQEKLPSGLRMSGNGPVANYLSFTPQSKPQLINGNMQIGTVTLCAGSGSSAKIWRIAINQVARARAYKGAITDCPKN